MGMENLAQQLSAVDPSLGAVVSDKPWILAVVALVIIWKLVWYGIALYKAGSKNQKSWFVVLFICALLLNDVGLLAILYLGFNRDKKHKIEPKKAKSKKKK
jgi:Kef-type K+ transport system membrane component KefB